MVRGSSARLKLPDSAGASLPTLDCAVTGVQQDVLAADRDDLQGRLHVIKKFRSLQRIIAL